MPASSVFQARLFSDNQTSTLGASGTQSIGTRNYGFASRTGPSTVTGGDFTATAIVLDRLTATLTLGQTLQLHASATTADGTKDETPIDTWDSSDDAVATVTDAGLVEVVGVGTCEIVAQITAGTLESDPCVITVVAFVGELTLADETLTFASNSSDTTTVTAKDQFGVSMALPAGTTCASSDVTKATVGIVAGTITVTGVAAGVTNVTASYAGVTSNTCVVTVTA